MEFFPSVLEENRALRRAAARAGCRVAALEIGETSAGARGLGRVTCADGWAAARFLLALAVEDARTPGARDLALALRRDAPGDLDFARAVHAFVKRRIRFVREAGEVFQGVSYTLATGGGDCDDHARAVYAIAVAGGLAASMAFLHQGERAPVGRRGPTHAVTMLHVAGANVWAETTLDAELGEHPLRAAERLGKVHARADLAREVRIMTERDLGPVPVGFNGRNPAPQVALDARALNALGYCAGEPESASDPMFRRAVLAFQLAHGGLAADALIGPHTRGAIGAALPDDLDGAEYRGALVEIEGVAPTARAPRIFTHAMAREILRIEYAAKFGRDPSSGELDFAAAVCFFESGYGRAGAKPAAPWAEQGQFAQWAAQGLYNWGALERGPDASGTCPAGTMPGKDAGTRRCFYVFPSDAEAAAAFWRSWGKDDTLKAAASGSAFAVAAAMRRHGYYEGFWVPPGNPGKRPIPPFKEAASVADAEARNIGDYAAALQRHVAVVRGDGGVPDPSRAGLLGSALGLALLLGVTAAGIVWGTA